MTAPVAADIRSPLTAVGLGAAGRRVAEDAAGPAADDVDRGARFPREAVEAMRAEGLLSALVDREAGGAGATVSEVANVITTVGRHCSSAGMVLAMHSIQVACLVAHGHTDPLRAMTASVVSDQLLLASATTERGVGGDIRTSLCAVETDGPRFRLHKEAMVISYGQYADAVLATARRTPDSAPNDQVLVVCERADCDLQSVGDWNVLGFRGTCSLGFRLDAEGDAGDVFPVPFGDISAWTMLPVSHVLWSSLWLGMAAAAVDRAAQFVRTQGRARPGTLPPSATRLAEMVGAYQQMSDAVASGARRWEASVADPDMRSGMGFVVAMNSLKVTASTALIDIVGRALMICGMAGYRDDGALSLGRLLRDAHGAALMVNNDRIIANNAQLLMVHREF